MESQETQEYGMFALHHFESTTILFYEVNLYISFFFISLKLNRDRMSFANQKV